MKEKRKEKGRGKFVVFFFLAFFVSFLNLWESFSASLENPWAVGTGPSLGLNYGAHSKSEEAGRSKRDSGRLQACTANQGGGAERGSTAKCLQKPSREPLGELCAESDQACLL